MDDYTHYCYVTTGALCISGLSDHPCSLQSLVLVKDQWCIFFTCSLVESNVPIFISLLTFLTSYNIYIKLHSYPIIFSGSSWWCFMLWGFIVFVPLSFSTYSHDIICISKILVATISTPNLQLISNAFIFHLQHICGIVYH